MRITVSGRVRISLLKLGIAVLLADLKFRFVEAGLNKWAVERAQMVMVTRREFNHYWFGVGVIQFPSDLIAYSELIYNLKPDLIIETGTYYGGLSGYLATVLEKTNPNGAIVTVDIDSNNWDEKSKLLPKEISTRILFIRGSSTSDDTVARISTIANGKKAMVILDSLHTKEHVLRELMIYSRFVDLNSYIIVNDTYFDVLGVGEQGALGAVEEFLKTTDNFVIDESVQPTITCAPSGFLKRVK